MRGEWSATHDDKNLMSNLAGEK